MGIYGDIMGYYLGYNPDTSVSNLQVQIHILLVVYSTCLLVKRLNTQFCVVNSCAYRRYEQSISFVIIHSLIIS